MRLNQIMFNVLALFVTTSSQIVTLCFEHEHGKIYEQLHKGIIINSMLLAIFQRVFY